MLLGLETELCDGEARQRLPRAWRRECRVFVEQPSGEVACTEQPSVEIGVARRLLATW